MTTSREYTPCGSTVGGDTKVFLFFCCGFCELILMGMMTGFAGVVTVVGIGARRAVAILALYNPEVFLEAT